ncbi:unnamed protein product [Ambrosiozyma monospora]|uniref:Unnamed protein product n=1 Tax=Ambrosiozyma monospora TaxID=43982 RepID=A0ACB5UA06_AMBMO|nr:unnamed protein product [Ambrosiozyma monospora]
MGLSNLNSSSEDIEAITGSIPSASSVASYTATWGVSSSLSVSNVASSTIGKQVVATGNAKEAIASNYTKNGSASPASVSSYAPSSSDAAASGKLQLAGSALFTSVLLMLLSAL